MDANKTIKLKQIEYQLQPSCGLCAHGQFPNDDWGTCGHHSYSHRKHTGEDRSLSVHKSGICSDFRPDTQIVDRLTHYSAFMTDQLAKNFA